MKDITTLLGIKYPIIQGAMAWIAEYNLASAVSNGGGLGIIATGSADVDWSRDQIRKLKEKTDKPFGVNIMLMNPATPDLMQLMIDEKVPVITTGAGNPGKYISGLKEAGVIVIPVVAASALAKRMEKAGADAVIAEGCEAGGHIGEETTMSLLPQVVDAVDIPVIGAGGIGDGRGAAAAFMLGASGLQIGTRFLLAKETQIAQSYKDKIIASKDNSTVAIGRTTGHPVRQLKNKMTKEVTSLEKSGIETEEFESMMSGTLRKAVVEGDVDKGALMAGQIAGLINKEQTAEEIMKDIMSDMKRVYSSLSDYII